MTPHPEYPRPDFDRSQQWLNLNGTWDFKADPANEGLNGGWFQADATGWSQDGPQGSSSQIVVPFPWESKASQVNHEWLLIGWYHRTIERPSDWNGRTILNFGAVFYQCTVWLNGEHVGEHVGGYLPFSFDVTEVLADGPAELVVLVETFEDKRFIPHGKQRSIPLDDYDGCAFTPSSGIWQTVWLEARPATYISSLSLRPSADLNAIEVTGSAAGPNSATARLSLAVQGQTQIITLALQGDGSFSTVLPVESPHLWSPADPHLYKVTAKLSSADGVDTVGSYTGLRKMEIRGEQILLNDQRIYVRAALDQGFWPQGIYTAPDDAALRLDVEQALQAGFNTIRKHIKFENPRWLYWADKLGLLVWEEPPCVGRFSPESIQLFESQLVPMVERDGNHPAIVIWGIYNEEWGLDWKTNESEERQQAVINAYDLLKTADPSRPIVDDSGWWHVKTDILDWHYYDMDMAPWQKITASLAKDRNSWFGHQLSETWWCETLLTVEGRNHDGVPLINGEYGGGRSEPEQDWLFRWQTQDIRRYPAFTGYTYTELYDVEYELAGLYTADRQPKQWGYEPSIINADTVVVFDMTPQKPGLDLVVENGELQVSVRIAHTGPAALEGKLLWGWQRGESPLGSLAISIAPFEVSAPLALTASAPQGETAESGRFYVWVATESNPEVACGLLDAALTQAGSEVASALAN